MPYRVRSITLPIVAGLSLFLGQTAGTGRAPATPSPAPQGTPSSQAVPPAAHQSPVVAPPSSAPPALSVIVLDPGHGGTDPGARGTGGIRESDVVLAFAAQVRAALEKEGFRVVQTRQGNENPSFDDRAAIANGQHGAIFITLHIGSTGLAGTARVYTLPPAPAPAVVNTSGLIPWEAAQLPSLDLSRKLADLTQVELTLRFKGSPRDPLTAPVRQLRSVAAPAMAIEVSNVAVEDRQELDQMGPGLADSVARAVAAFRPFYNSSSAPPTGGRP